MESSDLKYIGRKLLQIREAEGLTQVQFAQKVKLTQAAISQFEDGKRIPSSKALQKIAVGLEMSVDALIGNMVPGEENSDKNAAIQALMSRLRNESVNAEEIIALNRYYDARLGVSNSEEQK
jgi:transcriptional regulator with XRE-family HTH domain